MKIMRLNSLLKTQDGAVSLLAVSFASTLILLITVAMAGMMIGELRQAIDAENSNRAYYAAESGAEEALMGVKNQLASGGSLVGLNQNCDNAVLDPLISTGGSALNALDNTQITCRRVHTYGNPSGDLRHDKAAQLDLSSYGDPNLLPKALLISWDVSTTGGGGGGSLPPMEMAFTYYSAAGVANRDDVPTYNVVLSPCMSGDLGCSNLYDTANPLSIQTLIAAQGGASFNIKVPVQCKDSAISNDSYRCTVYMNNLAPAGRETVLRLRPLERDARYTMQVYNTAGNPLDVKLQEAQIDVTARVGDSFRRIQQQIQIRAGAYSGLDVIAAREGICKNFDVLDAPGGYLEIKDNGGCEVTD